MQQHNQAYLKLRQHLDSQAVGFPATRSAAELKILEHIFSPREAEIACCLSYRFEPLETIFSRAGHLVDSADELEKHLDCIQKKGGVESKIKNGRIHYCNAPLVVGMYEFQLNRLTPGFINAFNEYTSDKKFGLEFLSTKLPQMRTIPIARSIHPEHNVSTYDEVMSLLQQAEEPFAIHECICRKKKSLQGHTCKVTDRKETCLSMGSMARMALKSEAGREISREEAIAFIELNQKEGLVLQPTNSEIVEFICSCCGCCCGMLGIYQDLPKPLEFWATNFYATVDSQVCESCGLCVKRCQVNAVSIAQKKQPAVVNRDRCLGCGLCVPACPTQAMTLVKKPVEVKPPQTREALNEIMAANRKNRLEKLKLTGKLVVDSVRTGHMNLLKP
jgi:Pyruvate/2-oxoacid:ferredoxin oxidoreductase delta subunit